MSGAAIDSAFPPTAKQGGRAGYDPFLKRREAKLGWRDPPTAWNPSASNSWSVSLFITLTSSSPPETYFLGTGFLFI